jgi:hypothetical protein
VNGRRVKIRTRNEQMGGYLVAGSPSTFRFQPNDSRTVRFPAIFVSRADFVRSVRIAAATGRRRDMPLFRAARWIGPLVLPQPSMPRGGGALGVSPGSIIGTRRYQQKRTTPPRVPRMKHLTRS